WALHYELCANPGKVAARQRAPKDRAFCEVVDHVPHAVIAGSEAAYPVADKLCLADVVCRKDDRTDLVARVDRKVGELLRRGWEKFGAQPGSGGSPVARSYP